ncbi:unnamed protein product [Cylicostephanus goldi]|uniref:Uncharacterized protein n=1 Tax=Cylicostephanus goldi TaxID=71465 RepID=A0A3P7ME83_CYLGO|nr:unnamed protein product [Cylicostephanus goldi]
MLTDMPSLEGWAKHRPVGIWILGVWRYILEVDEITQDSDSRELHVVLTAKKEACRILKAIRDFGLGADNTALLDLYVKLGRSHSKANPAFESFAHMKINEELVSREGKQWLPTSLTERRLWVARL